MNDGKQLASSASSVSPTRKRHARAPSPSGAAAASKVSYEPGVVDLPSVINQAQLQLITDSLPGLVGFLDTRERFTFVSAGYQRWFGGSQVDLRGKHLREVVGDRAYEVLRPHVAKVLAGEVTTFEAEVPYVAGPRYVQATYTPLRGRDDEVTGFVAFVVDASERVRQEQLRAVAAERSNRLLKITAAIADAVTREQVFEAVVDQVAEVVGASSAALWIADERASKLHMVRSLGFSETARLAMTELSLEARAHTPALDCFLRGEASWFSSRDELLRRYPNLRSMVHPERTYRVACLPLRAHEQGLGVLSLTIDEAIESPHDERDFLTLVASYASQALERLRLFDEERRSRALADDAAGRMMVLSHASRAFVEATLEDDLLMGNIVRELGMHFASCVGISLAQDDGVLLPLALYHPNPEALREFRETYAATPMRVGYGITGQVVATGQSVCISPLTPEELNAQSQPAHRELLKRYPVYALACVPLRVRKKVIGAITAARVNPADTFADADMQLLEELAERAAATIENHRLYDENIEARLRAELLYRFAQIVVTADRVEEVFDVALETIQRALHTDRAAILVYDQTDVMRFRAWRGLSDTYRAAAEGHSPWSRDAIAPEPVLVNDVRRDPSMASYQEIFVRENIASLAFIPLYARGKLIGKFMVYYPEPHEYTHHELAMATAIANHLASVTARFAAIASLEETIRHNELFAGVLAHDLRNPLSAMMTAAQLVLMRQEGEGDKNAKPLGRILSSGQRMTRMIDQLLDFTRARAGGSIALEPHEADLSDLCVHAVEELEQGYSDWKIQRRVTGDLRGRWDPDRLLQVFSNLLANAGQHGQPGTVVRVDLDGGDPARVKFWVHNQGAVPTELLPHLFEPFRGIQHRRFESRGLGLGLFIVREIVRAHGGTVTVNSSPTAGTTFTVELPRRVSGHTAPAFPRA